MLSNKITWYWMIIFSMCVGMTIGYIYINILDYNNLLSLIENKSLRLIISNFYYFILLIGLTFAIEVLYRKREIYFQRIFPSKIMLHIMLNNAIGYLMINLYITNTYVIVCINLILAYILCKIMNKIIQFIKKV